MKVWLCMTCGYSSPDIFDMSPKCLLSAKLVEKDSIVFKDGQAIMITKSQHK